MTKQNLVVQYQKTPVWYAVFTAIILCFVLLSFLFGRYLAVVEREQAVQKSQALQQKLDKYQKAYQKANQDLVMQLQYTKVENLSNQQLVDTIKQLEFKQNKMLSELKFYRNIMAPELSKEGLTIQNFVIAHGSSDDKSKFKLVLTQAGKQEQFLKGEIELKLQGKNTHTGLPIAYAFSDLGVFQPKDFQFQFRYFKEIEGEITLPKAFTPEKVSISAKTKGLKKNQSAEKQVDWKA